MTSEPIAIEPVNSDTAGPALTPPPQLATGTEPPGASSHSGSATGRAEDPALLGEIGAGILGPDPMPALTPEELEELSKGLLEVTADYQAEHGEFTEEELAQARAGLSIFES